MVLGVASAMEAFHAFWSAARSVFPGALLPDQYPHHRFADPTELVSMCVDCGWQDVEVVGVNTVRSVSAQDAWAWLFPSLPIRLQDGTDVSAAARSETEDALRSAFDALTAPSADRAGLLNLGVSGWLLSARRAVPRWQGEDSSC